jgi:acetyl esterase/lipase
MLLYPVITMTDPFAHAGSRENLLGRNPSAAAIASLSTEQHVTARTPPTFLVTTDEDSVVPAENSLLFFAALRRAGVPAELHVFQKGAHGLGLKPGNGPFSEWPHLCEGWMRVNGWIPQPVEPSNAGTR